MIELEKYHGSASRHTCPACGRKKKFSRYIDAETGRYLADNVGRCDRESSCGYHYKPKEYFAFNPQAKPYQTLHFVNARKHGIAEAVSLNKNGSQSDYEARFSSEKPDFIENRYLLATLANYEQNPFVQFLLGLFPNDAGDVWQAVSEYLIGTNRDRETVFWQIDQLHRIRTGKIMLFDIRSGKRQIVRGWTDKTTGELVELKVFWMHKELKLDDFQLEQRFFGEHLLTKYPRRAIGFVESEKSAVIASICKGVFPDLIWIACGGKSNFKAESLARLGRDRTILIYPDADGFDKWQAIASDARKGGMKVYVSDLIEKQATDAERASGADLADYLIREQMAINEYNGQTPGDLETILQERIAIMMFDGGLSEAEALRLAGREVGTSWN